MVFTHYLLSFVEGVGLILSPCILPILPIVLATSMDGGSKRPMGIIAGFIFSFSVFALISHQIIQALDINPDMIRHVSLFLLILLGVTMMIPAWSEKLSRATEKWASLAQTKTATFEKGNPPGFKSGFLIGILIGFIWTPCAGPLMAAAIVQIAQSGTTMDAVITTLLFVTGAGLPMLFIALLGNDLMKHMAILKKHSGKIRTFFGALIITAAVLIWTGADVKLLTPMPDMSDAASFKNHTTLQNALTQPYDAPDIAGIEQWINSPPLTLNALKGKVVLIDFWTYSCINCVRTLPYVKAWYERYKDDGFVVIGVHAPEFAFEKKIENVQSAVDKFGITYPVAIDNNWVTWKNYKNRYWPAHYLINRDGQIVYTHFGEGKYNITEGNIRVLLGINTDQDTVQINTGGSKKGQTPETYLGYKRMDLFQSPEKISKNKPQDYSTPTSLDVHHWGLTGQWIITPEYITNHDPKATLKIHFKSEKVFLVLGSKDNTPIDVTFTLNGEPINGHGGSDVQNGVLTVDSERLYEIVDQKTFKEGVLEIKPTSIGLRAYAFTFGQSHK